MIWSLYGAHAAADNVGALRFLGFAGGPMAAAGAASGLGKGCRPSWVAEISSCVGGEIGGLGWVRETVSRADSPRTAPSCEAEGLAPH